MGPKEARKHNMLHIKLQPKCPVAPRSLLWAPPNTKGTFVSQRRSLHCGKYVNSKLTETNLQLSWLVQQRNFLVRLVKLLHVDHGYRKQRVHPDSDSRTGERDCLLQCYISTMSPTAHAQSAGPEKEIAAFHVTSLLTS